MTSAAPASKVRKRPPIFRALGRREPPDRIDVSGRDWALERVIKHDSWAATAIYRDAEGVRLIAKFNRQQSAFGLPMGWIGRMLARRESGFLRRLAHLQFVPNDLGPVHAGGKPQRHAIARVYIDGEPFTPTSQVDKAFFERLRALLDELHATGMAYVDLHKRENVLIDREGRPHLVDFQVSVGGRGGGPVVRRLQEMDDYHYRKHYARTLPETLTEEERRAYLEPPGFIRAHRRFAVPLRTLRRRLLTWLKVRDRSGEAHSELEPEDAFKRPPT